MRVGVWVCEYLFTYSRHIHPLAKSFL
jgi:hypothetical protein